MAFSEKQRVTVNRSNGETSGHADTGAGCVPSGTRHLTRFQCLGYSPDLIQLDQN
jgi:hypothetical protein